VKDVLSDLDAWTAAGIDAAVATVVGVRRSAPRPPGSKMVVSAEGLIAGAVSGGCVEGSVVSVADEILAGGPPQLLDFGIADEEAWEVGLPCGGEITVWVSRFEDGPSRAFADAARRDERAALVTRLTGPDAGATLLLRADGRRQGRLANEALDAAVVARAEDLMWRGRSELQEIGDERLFIDVTAPAPRLMIIGAVDWAVSLCEVARTAGWRPSVIDPRSRFARPDRFPAAERVVSAWPAEAIAELGGIDRATSIVALTHDPKLDDAALLLALASPAAYIGAMGSRVAQEGRRERLLEAGVSESDLQRIAAPVGLDLGAHSAGQTAVSIMGEIIALANGRRGGRLADGHGRIHAGAPEPVPQSLTSNERTAP
jgi:xanthine dehydrogenase accessory factor